MVKAMFTVILVGEKPVYSP